MKRVRRPVLALCVLLMAPYAFGQNPDVKNQVMMEETIAQVNTDVILKSEYEARLKALREQLAQPGAQGQPGLKGADLDKAVTNGQKDIMRDLIDETLLLERAKELGMNSELEIVKAMEKLRVDNNLATTEDLENEIVKQGMSVEDFKQSISTQYLVRRVTYDEVYNRINIKVEDLKAYYDAHQDAFNRPPGVSIAEIVVGSDKRSPAQVQAQRRKIEDALAELKKGTDFGAVAQKYSEDGSASKGGDLGFLDKGELDKDYKEYEDAVSKMTHDGEVSDILTMPYGFVILKLEARHGGGILPFEVAQSEVQDIIFSQLGEQKRREYLTKLREEGFISVHPGYSDSGAVKETSKVGGKP